MSVQVARAGSYWQIGSVQGCLLRRADCRAFAIGISSHEICVVAGAAVPQQSFVVMQPSAVLKRCDCFGQHVGWDLILWSSESALRPWTCRGWPSNT